jgi:hypothetical protein
MKKKNKEHSTIVGFFKEQRFYLWNAAINTADSAKAKMEYCGFSNPRLRLRRELRK